MVGGTVTKQQCILLLDDDNEFRALLGAVLSARGFEVLEASSAGDATALLLDESPDLVIVDGLLPDQPGVEWIESLRQHDPDTLVVFLSAFWRDLETFQRLTGELSVSLVAYKPIDPLVFAETIGELLRLQPKASESIPPTLGVAPADPPDSLRARMAQLREAYTLELPGKLEHLEALIDKARTRPELTKEAASSAHRLRGTAGAYGFKLVGVLAGQIEDLLGEYQSSPLRVRRNLWTEVPQTRSRQAPFFSWTTTRTCDGPLRSFCESSCSTCASRALRRRPCTKQLRSSSRQRSSTSI